AAWDKGGTDVLLAPFAQLRTALALVEPALPATPAHVAAALAAFPGSEDLPPGRPAQPIPGLDDPAEWDLPDPDSAMATECEALYRRVTALADRCPIGEGTAGARYRLITAAGLLAGAARQLPAPGPPVPAGPGSFAVRLDALLARATVLAGRSAFPADEMLHLAEIAEAAAGSLPNSMITATAALRQMADRARDKAAEFGRGATP
ncbi:MAG: hypothetical protein ACOYOH_28440, partial [Paracraurococcus sp.]